MTRLIHDIPFTPQNTEGFYTFAEAYKHWCRNESNGGFRCETPWGHWYVLNMWLHEAAEEEARHPDCPDCGLPMSDTTGVCHQCDAGTWLYT